MNQRIRSILEDLEAVRENLLALSDDIWLSIDHNDTESLDRGCEFKREYNRHLSDFDAVATQISETVQQFTEVSLQADEQTGSHDQEANERIVQQLNQEQAHPLDEDFTYTRPWGFVLAGKGASGLKTWRRIYEVFCRHLAARNPQRFSELPDNPDFGTERCARPRFARSPEGHHTPSEIVDGVFAEVKMCANTIAGEMRRLLHTFGIPQDEMQLFLREDRDAGRRS